MTIANRKHSMQHHLDKLKEWENAVTKQHDIEKEIVAVLAELQRLGSVLSSQIEAVYEGKKKAAVPIQGNGRMEHEKPT
jgi:hypothetical protein